MTFYLGIDAGGTHTRARLVSADGEVIGTGEAGPANTPEGLRGAVHAAEDAYLAAIAAAGLSQTEVGEICAGFGFAGLNRRGFLPGLKDHDFPFRWTRLASDASIAQLGAHGGGDGAVVIVGTGSIGFARVGGEVFTIGGYGFPVSDEGSGAELGLRAVRRALWARDGRIPQSGLTEQLLAHFHRSAGEIVDWTGQARPADYAEFAPLVMDLAEQGDPVAEQIVQESAARLDRLIRVLLDRGAEHCCLMGGVAGRMRDWLSVAIRERLRDPLGDALDGAILLARQPPEGDPA
jgi:glucosamine kinase